MSIHAEHENPTPGSAGAAPTRSGRAIPTQRGQAEQIPGPGWPVPVLRIALSLVFLWPFLDKTFGLGYATQSQNAWINGGSPTQGFLGNVNHGPFASMFRSWAGGWFTDWLFMLCLLGVGVALLAGIGLRIAAIAGSILMLSMWVAEWPPDRFNDAGEPTMSTNPIVDYHLIYALALIALAALHAGHRWGLGRRWSRLGLVRRSPWLH